MGKKGVAAGLVVAGALAAAAAVAFAQTSGRARPPGPKPFWERAEAREALGLSAEQLERLREEGYRQARDRIEREAQIRLVELDLHRLLRAAEPDEDAVRARAEELGRLRGELVTRQILARLAVARILTPEQREALDELEERARPRRRGRRTPPPEGPVEPR